MNSLWQCSGSPLKFLFLSDIVFMFNLTEFTFTEDSGTNLIPISLSSGNLGDFTMTLTGDTKNNDTATGKFVDLLSP